MADGARGCGTGSVAAEREEGGFGGHGALCLGQLTAGCGQEPSLIPVLTSLDCNKGGTGAAPGEAAAGQEVVGVDARCWRGCPRDDLEPGLRPGSARPLPPSSPGNSALCATRLRRLFSKAHPSPPADRALCPDIPPAACTWSRGRIPVEPCLSHMHLRLHRPWCWVCGTRHIPRSRSSRRPDGVSPTRLCTARSTQWNSLCV